MHRPRFTDPLGSMLPALEQNFLKHRAMEMILVMFYAEELKREILDRIQATDRWSARLAGKPERVPRGVKNPVDKALDALVADGAIKLNEKKEIVDLIDYRNMIAHRLHNMLGDLSPTRYARDLAMFGSNVPKYNYNAVKRLQYYHKRFDEMYRTHSYVTTLSMNTLLFRAAEKTFLAEIKRLKRKIVRQLRERNASIKKINSEMSLKGTGLEGKYDPSYPDNHYEGKRLTKRGVEICYRLFDLGKSEMASAHLLRLSLLAVKKRKKMWIKLGGKARKKADIDALPGRYRPRRQPR
ncbi:hypothetical protein [uncultured Bradyrhizobium sp.]|uniref:hypothetical protein n=1 Tax=uncultured Bradyrhizobium sp. TaxID=199684 RepID=UPI0035CA90FF